MGIKKVEFTEDSYYHVYNRGVDKRLIFMDNHDRMRFQRALYFFNDLRPVDMRLITKDAPLVIEGASFDQRKQLIDIGAYCLMPNHFHVLVKTRSQDGLSRFMKKLGTGYAMYFNKKHRRTGILFEGTFKAKLIENNEYLRHMSVYIHTNALELKDPEWKERGVADIASAHDFLQQYKWSSYQHYLGEKNDAILNLNAFPKYFEDNGAHQSFLQDWIGNHEYRKDYEGASFV